MNFDIRFVVRNIQPKSIGLAFFKQTQSIDQLVLEKVYHLNPPPTISPPIWQIEQCLLLID